MIRRIGGVLVARDPESAPEESRQLQQAGFAVLPEVLAPDEVMSLKTSILDVFERYPPDHRAPKPAEDEAHFRYELLNRSEAARACIANQRVLSVIEPLLGEDCHIIANTAWNNRQRQVARVRLGTLMAVRTFHYPKVCAGRLNSPGRCLQSECTTS